MRAKHLNSMCDQPNISLHQLCFLPCQNFPQLFELLFRLEGASLTTWIFPVGNSFFQLFRLHMNAQAVMSPGDRKFQFQRECTTATLYRSGDSKCLFICWLYILFPPKNSINHTDHNRPAEHLSIENKHSGGRCFWHLPHRVTHLHIWVFPPQRSLKQSFLFSNFARKSAF